MTSVEFKINLKSKNRGFPDIENQWQISGSECRESLSDGPRIDATETRFSAWTPITNKACNHQLFQERTTLILHWFDLWTDRQRKEFILQLLRRCNKTQLKFTSDCLTEAVPITRMDFTTVLPRFLSLYIMSFLSPRDICAAAQVSWHWRFLAEQDCLWFPKCIRLGWFLPYSPSDHEYGAWKRHYVACAASLDILTPREAAGVYGTLNESLTVPEEKEERWRELMIKQTIRDKIAEHKKAVLKTRRAWINTSKLGTSYTDTHNQPLTLTAALVHIGEKCRLNSFSNVATIKSQNGISGSLKNRYASSLVKSTSLPFNQPVRSTYTPLPHFLLVSSKVPGYELLLAAVHASVVVLPYDLQAMNLEALLSLAERAIQGRMLQSVGILAGGSTDEVYLTQGMSITEKTVLMPRVREFWEKLCGWVVPASEGGSLNIFAPLASSVAGMDLMRKLSSMTGLNVRAPTGMCTGSYQHILSEWSGSSDFPPLMYMHEAVLLSWCRQAEWIEEACKELRKHLEPQLHFLCQKIKGRILGLFLWDHIKMPVISIKSDIMECLIQGLVALMNETPDDAVDFLGRFLLKKSIKDGLKETEPLFFTERTSSNIINPIPEFPKGFISDADRRGCVCKELLDSERTYVRQLQAVATVFYTPLRAALDSNRAIISSVSLITIFCPLLDILEANKLFLIELQERLQEWGPLQCVGDVCVKFCTKLRAYTNFFNNYPTILKTIDKCRETHPVFRAFLKRHDWSVATRMLSLQELFLAPSARVEEYGTLLQALTLHTPREHPDYTLLSSALNTIMTYRNFLHKLKTSLNQDLKILEAQNTIQSCPNLSEGSRYLITTQEVASLTCLNGDITSSLRMYEHVSDLGLFLFNDALVLTEKSVSHLPFSLAAKTTHNFLASVALHCLNLKEITDTKYVQNAFQLESPKRQWICATDREEEKNKLMSALCSAINAAITQN
ncbi:epithelial cell-transforming sequence 2 oncogene-like isoform X1 [Triplophysa dalaica]|uniref:epithelial cell-transforming sequence 2 oncogene-like isoform X1 n=1 Tax=Triplophysa dalaica TaxID=1582913 RepID=UPI0024DFB098|nr:epithelial cell-transforming sequence 2 oncogene-like isoform X1 [Triplophysa dalaica]